MNEIDSNEPDCPSEGAASESRRCFLQATGKWSGAAILAAVAGGMAVTAPEAKAGGWINRRVGGGRWVNGGGGGGYGGGAWVNRRIGGGAWVNY